MDGTPRMQEESSCWGFQYFLAHLALGEVLVPGLEWVTLVGVDTDGRVHLMHLLLSVRVNVYSMECCLFVCLGELPVEGLPLVVEIPPDFFTARRSIRSVPRVDHITNLGGISLLDWQTKPCERATKAAETDYIDLACRGLAFIPSDCAAWLLRREAYGIVNVFEASAGLFPILTGQDPPFEAALDWFQFAYTADQAGAYVAPVSTVLAQTAVAEGDELFPALLTNLRRRYPEVYGSAVDTDRAPDRRELLIEEGEGLSGGPSSVNISIKLGAYAGRLANLNLAGIHNPIPNLSTVYLDTPLVGPTPDPLEYALSLGRLGHPSGYPLTSTQDKGSQRRLPPPPPP